MKQHIGVAWYKAEQWDLLRATASDSDVLEDTFAEWEEVAEKSLKEFKSMESEFVKVELDVVEFNKWCQENSKVKDGNSRSEYVMNKVKEQS